MGQTVPPSKSTVIVQEQAYLSFPAIASIRDRLMVIFRKAKGTKLDFNASILWVYSDDDGQSWSEPEPWFDQEGGDCRNCGGGTLQDGTAVFVFDIHGGEGAWRRTFFKQSTDGKTWSDPIRLRAENNGQTTVSVGNRALDWDDEHLYFPHFQNCGHSVLYHRPTGEQTAIPTVPRVEPTVVWNKNRELIAFSKGGVIDVSTDEGKTWMAVSQVDSVSQPDLITLDDGQLLFCYSGGKRANEFLLLSKTGRDIAEHQARMIFCAEPPKVLTDRGKAQCLQWHDEILTVLYESSETAGSTGQIHLVRTPCSALL